MRHLPPVLIELFLRAFSDFRPKHKGERKNARLNGGEGGIRTPDTLLGCNCLAGSPVRPLQHLSAAAARKFYRFAEQSNISRTRSIAAPQVSLLRTVPRLCLRLAMSGT